MWDWRLGSGTSSESTRQRLTDCFAIVMWDTYSSPDLEEKESSEEDDDCDSTMSNDKISSPRKFQEEDDDKESPEEDNDCDNTMSDDKMIPSSKSQENSGSEESSEDEDEDADSDTPPRNDKTSPPVNRRLRTLSRSTFPFWLKSRNTLHVALTRRNGVVDCSTEWLKPERMRSDRQIYPFQLYVHRLQLIAYSGFGLASYLIARAGRIKSCPPHRRRGRLLGICGTEKKKRRFGDWLRGYRTRQARTTLNGPRTRAHSRSHL